MYEAESEARRVEGELAALRPKLTQAEQVGAACLHECRSRWKEHASQPISRRQHGACMHAESMCSMFHALSSRSCKQGHMYWGSCNGAALLSPSALQALRLRDRDVAAMREDLAQIKACEADATQAANERAARAEDACKKAEADVQVGRRNGCSSHLEAMQDAM